MTKEKKLKRSDAELVSAAKLASQKSTPRFAAFTAYLLCIILLFFIFWAYFAKIDVSTAAQGVITTVDNVYLVQHLEGGIIKEIYVKEGSQIHKGQLIVELDDTGPLADLRQDEKKLAALQIQIIRLQAEVNNFSPLVYPNSLEKNYPDLVKEAKDLFAANQKYLEVALNNLMKSYQLSVQELNMILPLVKERVISDVEALRLRQQLNQIKSDMENNKNKYRANALDSLNKAQNETLALVESIKKNKDKVRRTKINSPIFGWVHQISIKSPGSVVKPGDTILSIVPDRDYLIVQANVPTDKIGFVHLNQNAEVSVNTYDYSIYGYLMGKIINISPTSITDKNGLSYYEVKIMTDRNYLAYQGRKLRLIPGMNVKVKILTGKRSVLSYILKPLYKAKGESLQER